MTPIELANEWKRMRKEIHKTGNKAYKTNALLQVFHGSKAKYIAYLMKNNKAIQAIETKMLTL